MSATKVVRLYFRIFLTTLIAAYCMGMMAYITVVEGDMALFSVFSSLLGTVIGLWAQELNARRKVGSTLNDSGSLTSGTPPPSPGIYA